MTQYAYIYDAVRTPRSKGKKDGALHEVKPIELGAGLLRELQRRYDLDTSYVDDVMMGCTSAVGEQGADVAKAITQFAGWGRQYSRRTDGSLLRIVSGCSQFRCTERYVWLEQADCSRRCRKHVEGSHGNSGWGVPHGS